MAIRTFVQPKIGNVVNEKILDHTKSVSVPQVACIVNKTGIQLTCGLSTKCSMTYSTKMSRKDGVMCWKGSVVVP